jgi:hypothetical protein
MTGILDCSGAMTDGLQLNLSTLLMFYGKDECVCVLIH